MKVLRVLLAAPSDRLSIMLVNYLIDGGHFVDIIEHKDAARWLKVSNFNLRMISHDTIDASSYDVLIDLDDVLSPINIPRLVFELHPTESSCVLRIVLWDEVHVELSRGDVPCVVEVTSHQNLDAFFEEVTELFIDAVVSLVRATLTKLYLIRYF